MIDRSVRLYGPHDDVLCIALALLLWEIRFFLTVKSSFEGNGGGEKTCGLQSE